MDCKKCNGRGEYLVETADANGYVDRVYPCEDCWPEPAKRASATIARLERERDETKANALYWNQKAEEYSRLLAEAQLSVTALTESIADASVERDKLRGDLDDAVDEMAALSSNLGAGIGDDTVSAVEYVKRIRWGVDHLVRVETERRVAVERERDNLMASLEARILERTEAVARAEAAEREADRLRHGVPIEGDFVCPHELRADNAERELERLVEEEYPWAKRYFEMERPKLIKERNEAVVRATRAEAELAGSSSPQTCADCGGTQAVERQVPHGFMFAFGDGYDAVELRCASPMWVCPCGAQWSDYRTENAHTEAIYQHLCNMVMTHRAAVVERDDRLEQVLVHATVYTEELVHAACDGWTRWDKRGIKL